MWVYDVFVYFSNTEFAAQWYNLFLIICALSNFDNKYIIESLPENIDLLIDL